MIAPGAAARPRGQHDETRTDPRKAAVRLPEIGAFEALEVPENARCTGRQPPLFSLSGGLLDDSHRTPTTPAPGGLTPASASARLQPAEGGEGSAFRGAASPPQGACNTAEICDADGSYHELADCDDVSERSGAPFVCAYVDEATEDGRITGHTCVPASDADAAAGGGR